MQSMTLDYLASFLDFDGNMEQNRDDLDYQLNQDKLNNRWNHKTKWEYTKIFNVENPK